MKDERRGGNAVGPGLQAPGLGRDVLRTRPTQGTLRRIFFVGITHCTVRPFDAVRTEIHTPGRMSSSG